MVFPGFGESTFHRHLEVKEALDLEAEAAACFQLGLPENTAHKLYKSVVIIHATEIDSPTFHDPEAEAESGEDTDNEQSQASVRGGDRGGPATMGGPGRGDVRGGPATGGMRELAKGWVLVKKGRSIQFLERSVWRGQTVANMIAQCPLREKCSACMAKLSAVRHYSGAPTPFVPTLFPRSTACLTATCGVCVRRTLPRV